MALLQKQDEEFRLTESYPQYHIGPEALVAVATNRHGEIIFGNSGPRMRHRT